MPLNAFLRQLANVCSKPAHLTVRSAIEFFMDESIRVCDKNKQIGLFTQKRPIQAYFTALRIESSFSFHGESQGSDPRFFQVDQSRVAYRFDVGR